MKKSIETETIGTIQYILTRRRAELDTASLMTFFKALVVTKKHDTLIPTYEIPYVVAQNDPSFRSDDPELTKSILSRLKYDEMRFDNSVKVVIAYSKIADEPSKVKIGKAIQAKLNKEFDSLLYRMAVAENLIDYTVNFETFLKLIPFRNISKEARLSFLGYDDYRNDQLDFLVFMAGHNGVDLTDPRFKILHDEEPYYQWLLDMEGFDYERFEVAWLLNHRHDQPMINKFKANEKIVMALRSAVTGNAIPALKDFYIKHFHLNIKE